MNNFLKSSGMVLFVIVISLITSQTVRSFSSSIKPIDTILQVSKTDDTKNEAQQKSQNNQYSNFDFVSVFADIAEATTPSVVSVIPTQIDTIVYSKNPFYSPFGNDFFDQFFNQGRRRNQPPQQQLEKREERREGLGSGVIVSKDGYILTNFHVVNGADELKIKLNDGREYDADIVGSDSLADVAVIKLKGDVSGIKPITLGNSSILRPGDWTVAIGNPFSLTSSVTVGIVSALGRQVQQSAYQNFIQTDAAINPGNSGGALLNIKGELIGINTMIFSKAGGFNGIGFAVPVNMAKKIMDDIIKHGKVIRGWIGVAIQDISPTTREAMDLGEITGTLVSSVYEDQPADDAGIKAGDIVTKIEGEKIKDANHLKLKVAELPVGDKSNFTIFRDGKEFDVKVKVTEREKGLKKLSDIKDDEVEKEKDTSYQTNLGLTLKESAKGVVITALDNKRYNVSRYLRVGDVISTIKIKGKAKVKVDSIDTFEKTIKQAKSGTSLLFEINRDGSILFVSFRI